MLRSIGKVWGIRGVRPEEEKERKAFHRHDSLTEL